MALPVPLLPNKSNRRHRAGSARGGVGSGLGIVAKSAYESVSYAYTIKAAEHEWMNMSSVRSCRSSARALPLIRMP